ncbi:MAG: hypothetical protein CVV28_11630 [Methanobacteriales archaeon HGW-Methanobacteriales-1]|jgi:hypothetical protein|nr:MAG: hypothetical protein CVV28_11630 [Methanobacteriales archaeon HGW-Methanobacteriales-1]
MKDYNKIFNPDGIKESDENLISGAIKCLDDFGYQFNLENLKGMDDFLHFPHYLLSGNEVIVWNTRGQLPENFFHDLKKQGWSKTVTQKRELILVSSNKVHFKVKYTREKEDGTIISEHENIWIVIHKNNKWGIFLRSY